MANAVDPSCSAGASLRLSTGSGEAEDTGSVTFGIVIGLLASVGINLGQNIQNTNADDPTKARVWWFGFGLFVFSAIANFVAFAFAPASVLAPLEGAQFVTNFAYGLFTRNKVLYNESPMHKEKAGWRTKAVLRTGFGTSIVVVGITLPIITAPSDVAVFDEDAINCFWGGVVWWVYFVSTSVLAASCFIVYRIIRPTKLVKEEIETRLVRVRDTSGSLWNQYFGPKVEKNKTFYKISDVPPNNKHNKVHMALFAIPSAILGAFAVVQAKAISELVEPIFTEGKISVLGGWLFWQCLLFIIVGLGPWFWLLNKAPYYYEVLAILPLMQGCYIIFSSIAGGVFFEEFEVFSAVQAVMFTAGLLLIATGLWFIIPEKPTSENGDTAALVSRGSEEAVANGKDENMGNYTVVMGGFFMPIVFFPVDHKPSPRTKNTPQYAVIDSKRVPDIPLLIVRVK
jgi:hypothetical protein